MLNCGTFYNQSSCTMMYFQSFLKLALKELFYLILSLNVYFIKTKLLDFPRLTLNAPDCTYFIAKFMVL